MELKKVSYYLSAMLPLYLIFSLRHRSVQASLREDSNFICISRIEDHLIKKARYTLSDIFSSIKKINGQQNLFRSIKTEKCAELIRKTLYDELICIIDEIDKRKNIFEIDKATIHEIRDLCIEQKKLFTAKRTLKTSYQHLKNYNNYSKLTRKADQIQAKLHESLKDAPIEIGTVLLSRLPDQKRAMIETITRINILGAKANFCANMAIDDHFKHFIDEYIKFVNLPLREAGGAFYGAITYTVIEIGKLLYTQAKKNNLFNLIKDSFMLILMSLLLIMVPSKDIYLTSILLSIYSYAIGAVLLNQFNGGLLELIVRLVAITSIFSMLFLSINPCHEYCIRRLQAFPIIFVMSIVIINLSTILSMC